MSKGISCYRNLHRKGVVWSIKSNRTGLVVSRSPYVVIKNATFVVSQAGRKRVLKEKRKNVHATVRGTWIRGDIKKNSYDFRGFEGVYDSEGNRLIWVKVSYNPYKGDSFVIHYNSIPVKSAETVVLDEDGAWALLPVYKVWPTVKKVNSL